jgi:spore maturation protein CgeB
VDPAVHFPIPADPRYGADLSYLGTYAADRQAALEALFIEPARRAPQRKFILAGSLYRDDFPWERNIFFVDHLAPADHPSFYCSARLTLNVTRASMAAVGYCPSGRLFEAAACGSAILSDSWNGLDAFYTPGEEILTAADTESALAALDRSPRELAQIAGAARERTLAQHTADARAGELESILSSLDPEFPVFTSPRGFTSQITKETY